MGVLSDFLDPYLQFLQGLGVVEGKSEKNARDSLVEGADDGSEGLLSWGVPDLHFDKFSGGEFENFGGELDADGDIVLLWELAFDVAENEGGLSGSWVRRWIPWAPRTMVLKVMSSLSMGKNRYLIIVYKL